MGAFARSFELMKQSAAVLRQDRELMILPMVSGLCMLAAFLTFFVPMRHFKFNPLAGGELGFYAILLGFYIIVSSIGIFFQAALVSGAIERMGGGDPTIGSAIEGATRRLGTILLWGLIAGSIGFLIRMLEERFALVGKIVMMFVGAAWSLSTFFVVPVLVMEDESIAESFKRSFHMISETWGESVIGGSGFGLLSGLCMFAVGGIGMFLMNVHAGLGISVIVLGWCAITIYFSALQGIFVAALYLYASDNDLPEEFDAGFVQSAFSAR